MAGLTLLGKHTIPDSDLWYKVSAFDNKRCANPRISGVGEGASRNRLG